MTRTIHLLGHPRIERDGVELPGPRGHKAWGLLAYVLLTDAAVHRERLARMLFPDAADAGAALRWNLSQLRQAVDGLELEGDPLRVRLPDDVDVDVTRLAAGDASGIAPDADELLAGTTFDGSPGFELWLASERRRVLGILSGLLHEEASGALGAGDADRAAAVAERLVTLDPYDENAHVLLVRSMRAAGRIAEAQAQVISSTELLARELGAPPTSALRRAAELPAEGTGSVAGRGAVLAQLDAGEAAVAAGATDAGIDTLRRAVLGARAADAEDLLARALVALGGALIHAARGDDEDALPGLHEAAELAAASGDAALLATAQREIGWVDMLRARYERGRVWLDRARSSAVDPATLAWVDASAGVLETDVADYETAFIRLDAAVATAGDAGERRPEAFALAMRGRAHLLRGDLDEAIRDAAAAEAAAQSVGWTSFVPFPSAIHAEALLLAGDVDDASVRFEHAFALGCQVGDPCWESLAARGMGLVAVARGDTARAFELLDDAPRRCRRLPDSYLWVEAYAMDALCGLMVEQGHPDAEGSVDRFDRMVSSAGMRELRARAAAHWSRLGEEGAGDTAAALADAIDNPRLRAQAAALV